MSATTVPVLEAPGVSWRTNPSKASVVRTVDFRMVPYLIEATLIPTVLVSTRLIMLDLRRAIVATLGRTSAVLTVSEAVRTARRGLHTAVGANGRSYDYLTRSEIVSGPAASSPDGRGAGRGLQGVRHPWHRPRSTGRGAVPGHRCRVRSFRGHGPPPRRPRHAVVQRVARARLLRRRRPRGRRRDALGLVSTDSCTYAAGQLDSPAAMFTASHNPAQYNGIKLCLAGARPVGLDTGLADIKEMARRCSTVASCSAASWRQRARARPARRLRRSRPVLRRHVGAEAAEGGRRHGERHGRSRRAARVRAACRSTSRSCTASSTAPSPTIPPTHSSRPTSATCKHACRATGADVGLAFDGDADLCSSSTRPGAVCPVRRRRPSSPAASSPETPARPILHNLICSRAVPEVIREHGGTPIRTRVGHSYIKQLMAETGAAFGGEHSAHYYFRDNYRADSGIIATMVLLEQLSLADIPLSELRQPFERYADSGEINTQVPDVAAAVERVAERYRSCGQDHLDGLTVDCGHWWFNLRPSNTEPLLRLNLEAPTPAECDERVAEVLSLITPDDDPAHESPSMRRWALRRRRRGGGGRPPARRGTRRRSAGPSTPARTGRRSRRGSQHDRALRRPRPHVRLRPSRRRGSR